MNFSINLKDLKAKTDTMVYDFIFSRWFHYCSYTNTWSIKPLTSILPTAPFPLITSQLDIK